MDAFYETSLTKGIIGLMELYINTKRERERYDKSERMEK